MAFGRQNLSSWTTISRILVTASLAVSNNAHAIFGLGSTERSELQNRCETALANLNNTLGRTIDFGDIVNTPSAHVESAADGTRGGRLITIARDGNSWASVSAAEVFSPQGDPRWLMQLIGPDAAAFFGFKMLAQDRMTVPDAAELNGAIKAVNEVLVKNGKDAIPVSFYGVSSYSSEDVRANDYIRQFANGGLPIATAKIERTKKDTGRVILTDAVMLHGIATDANTITIPASLLKYRMLNAQVITAFFDSMFDKYKSDAAKVSALKYYALEVEKSEKHSIDSASSAMVMAMLPIMDEESRRSAVNALMGDKQFISRVVKETLSEVAEIGDGQAALAVAALAPSEVQSAFEAFENTRLGRQLSKAYETFYSGGFVFSGDVISRMILSMNERRQEIRDAALELAPKKATRAPKKTATKKASTTKKTSTAKKASTTKKAAKKTTAKKKSDN